MCIEDARAIYCPDALKDTMIMLVPMLLVLAAIITWPEIPLLLPRLISPEFLR
jgi:hypothetical protein